MTSATRPRILVLLATHNGEKFLPEQLDTVLSQVDVEVSVIVSDDSSSDSTPAIIASYETRDRRVTVLPAGQFGSAGANFARLIREADSSSFDAIALCDQDDRWLPWKLSRHASLLLSRGHQGDESIAAVSSNVLAFSERGDMALIEKNQVQRLCDYAFESGGPGSTFLLRPASFELIRRELDDPLGAASRATSHDWLIYALVRASGKRWVIDDLASVEYRQHGSNELGANRGTRQYLRRLRSIADGSHRHEVAKIVEAALSVASADERDRLEWLSTLVARRDLLSRMRLARRARELRRRPRDAWVLALTLILGIW